MKSLIVSVSPNTSTDRVSIVENWVPGEPARTLLSFDQAGGSGAHSTGVVQQLGGDACSIVLLGDYNRERWIRAAERENMAYDYVEMGAPNRSTFVLIDKQKGNVAEIIDAGPQVHEATAQELMDKIAQYLDDTGILILSGSLPPGIPDDFYAQVIRLAHLRGVKTLVDAKGEPLRFAMEERPWAIKPNLVEFHQAVGFETRTLNDHITRLREFVGRYAEVVLLSLGEDGVLVATTSDVWHLTVSDHLVTLPDSTALNTTGCGDALVGGFCYSYVRSEDVLESARWGVAAATATLGTYGVPSCPPDHVRDLIERVQVVSATANV